MKLLIKNDNWEIIDDDVLDKISTISQDSIYKYSESSNDTYTYSYNYTNELVMYYYIGDKKQVKDTIYNYSAISEDLNIYSYVEEDAIEETETYTFNNIGIQFMNKSNKGADLYTFKINDNDIGKDSKFLELFNSKLY